MKNPLHSLSVVVLIFFSLAFNVTAQVGIGTSTPNSKAVLELKSPGNNQGFLVPRLTTAERTAIGGLSSSERGLLVFDTDTNKFHYWTGSAWIVIEDSTGTDSQTLSFTSPNLSISGGNSINLSTINTDNQDLSLTTNTLSLSGDATTVDLAPYLDNTDNQDLSLTTNTLSLSGDATTVSLAGYLDNTDAQTLAFTPATSTLAISGGNSVSVTATGAANGDLNGTYPSPTVDGLQGVGVSATAPVTGQVLKYNGTAWAPGTDNNSGGGGITGGSTADGQVAIWSGASNVTGMDALFFDSKENRLGINTNKPLGTLHVAGSQFVNNQILTTDNYSVKPSDYSLIFLDAAKPTAVTLPAIAPDNIGRVLIFRTLNSSSVTLVGASEPKDEIDLFGGTYSMQTNGEQYSSLILIATDFPGQDRWMIVSGTK